MILGIVFTFLDNFILGLVTMVSMFVTIGIMMVVLIKYERHMPPVALLSFMNVIIHTMIAYALSLIYVLALFENVVNDHIGNFATIFYGLAVMSAFFVAEGKRAGKIDDGTFLSKETHGFFANIF